MHFRGKLTRLLSTSMMVLVLLASLPEVVCCCNVSWGPLGFLSSTSASKRDCSSSKSCCCCRKAAQEQTAHGGASLERGPETCSCTFHLSRPRPMSADSQPVAVMDVGAMDLCNAVPPITDLDFGGIRVEPTSAASRHLTAASRCALIQSWRI
jgi:hypothetical protein